MSKTFKEVAHLYLGCDVKIEESEKAILCKVGSYEMGEDCEITYENQDVDSGFCGEWETVEVEAHTIKPILYRLDDMAEKDLAMVQLTIIDRDLQLFNRAWTISQFAFLLSKNYDLFNLIDNGQAIDAKTLTNKTNQ